VSAVLEASRWIDASPENKRETAQILSRRAWLNTKEQYLTGRMLGEYDNGIGKRWQDATPSASSTTGRSAIRICPTACGS
jgi:nitrate/nitrite transport system substrate-binding protein